MAADGPAIRTRALEKRYDDFVAVKPLDLEVRYGEVFGLLGPNGAGKTTTILMLLGLTEASGGSAEVVGLDPSRHPLQVKRRVGYLPDNVGFYGSLTGRQNLRYTARLNGIPDEEAKDSIDDLLEQVALTAAADSAVETYSRGMRQRLGLADALVKDPSVVILDEPTTSIDPTGVVETLALVRALAHERGAAVLLASHLLHQVQQVCDRIAIFVAGDVVASGSVSDLARRQPSGAHVSLEVGAEGEPDAVAAVLRGVEGVTAVEPEERDRRLWLATGSPAIRAAVPAALLAAGLVPWHLRSRGMELDEIYQRYFAAPSARAGDTRRTRGAGPIEAAVPAAPALAASDRGGSTAPARQAARPIRRRRAIHRSDRTDRPREDGSPREDEP